MGGYRGEQHGLLRAKTWGSRWGEGLPSAWGLMLTVSAGARAPGSPCLPRAGCWRKEALKRDNTGRKHSSLLHVCLPGGKPWRAGPPARTQTS